MEESLRQSYHCVYSSHPLTSLVSKGVRENPLAWSLHCPPWTPLPFSWSEGSLPHGLQHTHFQRHARALPCGGPIPLCPAAWPRRPDRLLLVMASQAVRQGVQSKISNQSHRPSHPPPPRPLHPAWGTLECFEHTRGRRSTRSVTTVIKGPAPPVSPGSGRSGHRTLDLCSPSQPLPPSSAASIVLSSRFSQPPHERPELGLSTGQEHSSLAGIQVTHPPRLVHSFSLLSPLPPVCPWPDGCLAPRTETLRGPSESTVCWERSESRWWFGFEALSHCGREPRDS